MTDAFNKTKNIEALRTIFDPVKNARSLGFIFLVLGIIGLPVNVIELVSKISILSIMSFLSSVIILVVAFGLFKSKIWAVYAFGIATLLSIVDFVYSFVTTGEIKNEYIFAVAINCIIFIWFYPAIKRFNK